jgi:hypothetical protein
MNAVAQPSLRVLRGRLVHVLYPMRGILVAMLFNRGKDTIEGVLEALHPSSNRRSVMSFIDS